MSDCDLLRKNILVLLKYFFRFLYIISIIAFLWLLFDGLDYYSTSYQERPHHQDYRNLRPAGMRGMGYGVIGATMMILMFLYTIRKRTKILGVKSSLRVWLNIHIYFGIFGPLLILLHTSFKVNGLVAVSFWSMVAVALSGIMGRYLYLQIPRNIEGHELSLEEIESKLKAISEGLQNKFDLKDNNITKIDTLNRSSLSDNMSIATMFITVIKEDLINRFTLKRLTISYLRSIDLPESNFHFLLNFVRERNLLLRRIIMLSRVKQLFHYWHVIHKPFAIVMYVIMLLHISVAIWTGYTWIF